MWQLGAVSFHWYGLVVGCAVALAWWNLEAQILKHQQKMLSSIEWLAVIFMTLVAARAWHVMTEWRWYVPLLQTTDWWQIFAVWQGGLSILGAVLGLVLSVWWLRRASFMVWLDCVALVLPWSQAVGRLANWVNQELYGWPTQLPWGIAIDAEHRLAAVQTLPLTTKFHPLFAYEAIGMLLLGLLLNRLSHLRGWKPGFEKIWWSYVLGYSGLRFCLDFLRIDRGPVLLELGFNQWLLLVSGAVSMLWLLWLLRNSNDYTSVR